MPRTPAQAEAARQNGAKSRGPTTAPGKQASSRNAIKHGLLAQNIEVIAGEDHGAFNAFKADFYARFQPADTVERATLDQLISAYWRYRRLIGIEGDVLEEELGDILPTLDAKYETISEGRRTSLAFRSLSENSGVLHLIARYETTLRRTILQSYRMLLDLIARRPPSLASAAPQSEARNEPEPPSTSTMAPVCAISGTLELIGENNSAIFRLPPLAGRGPAAFDVPLRFMEAA